MDRVDESEQNEVNQQNTSQQIHSSNNEQILENEEQQKYYQTNKGQEQQNSTDGQLIETRSDHLNNQKEGIDKQNENNLQEQINDQTSNIVESLFYIYIYNLHFNKYYLKKICLGLRTRHYSTLFQSFFVFTYKRCM
ncbi:unnamed protein product [Meloidogyne enterolobii]|uniref:Uncharacterized protein n=1 Tax=Meloidogyne enterolobii TaxID=390850 RepID=A0ACB1AG47_MELEN